MAFKGNDNKPVQSANYIGSIPRTKKVNYFDFRTTFNAGKLIPIYAREIYPAMNDKIDCGELVRSITPIGPTMDNSFLDIYYFFVPCRLLWDHWEEFIAGYNKEAWAQDVQYTTPQIKFKAEETGRADPTQIYKGYVHSFLDYLPQAFDPFQTANFQDWAYAEMHPGEGVTPNLEAENVMNSILSISALYPRAYVKIWNDWFRDENLQDELELYTGDSDEYADEFCFDLLDPDALPNACKLHDRFTSCLPAPLKGPDVLIPMQDLPVSTGKRHNLDTSSPKVSFKYADGSAWSNFYGSGNLVVSNGVLGYETDNPTLANNVAPDNLYAKNISNTIRMLRLATQTELLLARDARGGTRYVESILSHFKVHNGDARLQRSEYLGSKSIPLNVQQVTNTSLADGNALGNVGGQSVTKDNSFYFSKGFSEWGIVLGVAVVRTALSYSSGIHKQYQRKGRFDYIWPEFRHVGDVPLYVKEHDITMALVSDYPTGGGDKVVFGYTPYGSELRNGLNYNNGLFRAGYGNTGLSYLTYQILFDDANLVTLDGDYIQQPSAVIGNTLTVSDSPFQFFALFHIEEELVIPLDPTSDPGLMDHF